MLCLIACALCLAGCATVVIPPADLHDPAPVFVLDHGQHSSLVLPAEGGRMVRYSYGDWDYYALRKVTPVHGLRAILWPTQAALGRRELPGPPQPGSVERQVRVVTERMFIVHVEAGAVRRLREELDAVFRAGLGTLLYNEVYDLEFVEHPVPYTFRYNSNYVVAEWLRKLGCEVRGNPVLPNWKIVEPASPTR
jgi:hypothetical protein